MVPMAGTASRSVSSAATQQIELLQQELGEMQAAADGFEKERDFYFESGFPLFQSSGKRPTLMNVVELRSIEVFVQAKSTEEGVEPGQAALLKQIMDMLYSTEASLLSSAPWLLGQKKADGITGRVRTAREWRRGRAAA